MYKFEYEYVSVLKYKLFLIFNKKIRYIFKMWVMLWYRSGVNKKDIFKL